MCSVDSVRPITKVCRFTYGLETCFFTVSSHDTYDEIILNLAGKFVHLKVGSFILRYSVVGSANCLLDRDDDVKMMLSVRELTCISIIEVQINDIGSSSNVAVEFDRRLPIVQHVGISEPLENECSSYGSTYSDDEDEDILSRGRKKKRLLSSDWEGYIYKQGQFFEGGVAEFRECLSKYSIEKGFDFKYVKNDKERVVAECRLKEEYGCNWNIRASIAKENGIFIIRKLNNEHTCVSGFRHKDNIRLNSNVIASIISEKVRADPLIRPKALMDYLKLDYGFNVKYHTTYRAKEVASKNLNGAEEKGYAQLPWYMTTLEACNPGSKCALESNDGRFYRLFISYAASVAGFRHCLPVIFIDGTFVKNKYKGQLIGACAKTGNKDLFPLAFAIVDSESKENCVCFFEKLALALEEDDRPLSFVTDRGAGFLDAAKQVFPDAPHTYCVKHLKDNIRKLYPCSLGAEYKNAIVSLFDKCLYSRSVEEFNSNIEILKDKGKARMVKFLDGLEGEHYSIVHFPGKRYGETSNAAAESYNNWIRDIRLMPLPQLLEAIRIKVMVIMAERKIIGDSWRSTLTQKGEERLKLRMEACRTWTVNMCSEIIFEVFDDKRNEMVNIFERTCSCLMWQHKRFPCSHAVAVFLNRGLVPYHYIDEYWTAAKYRQCYERPIFPVLDYDKPAPESFGEAGLLPPKTKIPPGRPRTKRRRAFGECRERMCSRCNTLGHHNRATCSAPI